MTTGSGLAISTTESNTVKQNTTIRQLIEGRSNAVGTCTLAVSPATTTTVTAVNCSASSAVFLFPTTAHAAAALGTTYISAVAGGAFTITHAASANADNTFYFVCLG